MLTLPLLPHTNLSVLAPAFHLHLLLRLLHAIRPPEMQVGVVYLAMQIEAEGHVIGCQIAR